MRRTVIACLSMFGGEQDAPTIGRNGAGDDFTLSCGGRTSARNEIVALAALLGALWVVLEFHIRLGRGACGLGLLRPTENSCGGQTGGGEEQGASRGRCGFEGHDGLPLML